jgi:hypothetical protein
MIALGLVAAGTLAVTLYKSPATFVQVTDMLASPISCGNDRNKYVWETRACIIKAFETCTPATASYQEDGVGWEASSFRRTIRVVKTTQSCALEYETKGETFTGPYSYKGTCLGFNVAADAALSKGRSLVLEGCSPKTAKNSQLLIF